MLFCLNKKIFKYFFFRERAIVLSNRQIKILFHNKMIYYFSNIKQNDIKICIIKIKCFPLRREKEKKIGLGY